MTGGCKFCGKSTNEEYCSELCEQLFYGYLHRVETFGILYVICLIVSLVLFIIPVFLGHFVQFYGLA
jgi:predicted nucleic acid-binding Zn ribbon protein